MKEYLRLVDSCSFHQLTNRMNELHNPNISLEHKVIVLTHSHKGSHLIFQPNLQPLVVFRLRHSKNVLFANGSSKTKPFCLYRFNSFISTHDASKASVLSEYNNDSLIVAMLLCICFIRSSGIALSCPMRSSVEFNRIE
jgi:hypothetical protein